VVNVAAASTANSRRALKDFHKMKYEKSLENNAVVNAKLRYVWLDVVLERTGGRVELSGVFCRLF